MVTVSPPDPAPGARSSAASRLQARGSDPLLHLCVAEAEPAMRLAFAQELQLVRCEIDDEKTPAGESAAAASAIARPGSSRKCSTWWMTTRSKLSRNDRQVHPVAEPHARMVDRRALQIGARHREHGRRKVDAERTLVAVGEELQHAAGAGADVEHGAERAWPARGSIAASTCRSGTCSERISSQWLACSAK